MTNAAAGMPCPICKVPLVMSERQGVEIDYCPQCRGVWLDRGELDKIIERGSQEMQSPPSAREVPAAAARPDPRYSGHGQHGGYHKRRKSFLEELFD